MKNLNAFIVLAFSSVVSSSVYAANACQNALLSDTEIFQLIQTKAAIEKSTIKDLNFELLMHDGSRLQPLEVLGKAASRKYMLGWRSLQDGRLYWITRGRSQNDQVVRVKLHVSDRIGVIVETGDLKNNSVIWLTDAEVSQLWVGY